MAGQHSVNFPPSFLFRYLKWHERSLVYLPPGCSEKSALTISYFLCIKTGQNRDSLWIHQEVIHIFFNLVRKFKTIISRKPNRYSSTRASWTTWLRHHLISLYFFFSVTHTRWTTRMTQLIQMTSTMKSWRAALLLGLEMESPILNNKSTIKVLVCLVLYVIM